MDILELTKLVERHIERALSATEPLSYSERQMRSGLAYGALGMWNDLAALQLGASELVARRDALEGRLKEQYWALPKTTE